MAPNPETDRGLSFFRIPTFHGEFAPNSKIEIQTFPSRNVRSRYGIHRGPK